MNYITSSNFKLYDSAVALGKFEGVHRGHQLLLNEINKHKNNQLQSVVFTFNMPPRLALGRETAYQQIFTREERHDILEKMGINVLIEYPFTKEFASLSPDEFVKDILVRKAGARVVVVGTDFRFGKKRSGGIKDLMRLSKPLGYKLIVKDKLQEGNVDISSSRIRSLLESGSMEEAAGLLGRPYCVRGTVVHGKALGRTIEIPTVNLLAEKGKLTPPNGVYVSKIHIGDETHFGITNVGVKPTVEDHPVKGIETYIFDFDQDVYDRDIEVELLHFCRPEIKFQSIKLLKAQMQKDISFGKQYIKGVK